MPGTIAGELVVATISKHHISGIIAIIAGAVVVGIGVVRAALRVAMLAVGSVVVVIGILLFTRTI
jgi:hypothetical protein